LNCFLTTGFSVGTAWHLVADEAKARAPVGLILREVRAAAENDMVVPTRCSDGGNDDEKARRVLSEGAGSLPDFTRDWSSRRGRIRDNVSGPIMNLQFTPRCDYMFMLLHLRAFSAADARIYCVLRHSCYKASAHYLIPRPSVSRLGKAEAVYNQRSRKYAQRRSSIAKEMIHMDLDIHEY
jgi:hypothetical protein